ncbi:MAG: sulfite exporter TauE/SafE family protein [Mucilaginibacter polytrichastri]|nr:sulfite exporter TauE/SafE family protein [Mucilaginibacter polytrichastri]
MTILLFSLIILVGGYAAGLLGSLTGLGGGVIVIPMLTLIFGVNIHYAIGASLISVIATSSGSAAAYVRDGLSNIRIGLFLEIATTVGAICGAFLSAFVNPSVIAVIFGVILIFSALLSVLKKPEDPKEIIEDATTKKLRLAGSYQTAAGRVAYGSKNAVGGFFMMLFAGTMSGLLGLGSGALKVLAMDNIMRLPFKVSTATSNFMIGVTAAASAGIYFQRGYIDPALTFPIVLGVLGGAITGSRILKTADVSALRKVFAVVIVVIASEMIYNGVNGKL